MTEEATLLRYASACGWNADTQLGLVMRYIENQHGPEAFMDFLAEIARQELVDDYFDEKDRALENVRETIGFSIDDPLYLIIEGIVNMAEGELDWRDTAFDMLHAEIDDLKQAASIITMEEAEDECAKAD